ncbi:MAG: Tetratricopeptide 2 repeat-containing protein [Acidobacteriaceae bacterium]|nr:Tetratricopeptide 2 repeat-containing protein [Acidobacteriaceae bacterium]
MKSRSSMSLTLAIFFLQPLYASSNPVLDRLIDLDKSGQYERVSRETSAMLATTNLSVDDTGAAWVLLGSANQAKGDFVAAQNAYDKALHLYHSASGHEEDEGRVLEHYATLYRDLMEQEAAINMEKKALSIFERYGQHALLARSYATLAQLEMSEGKSRACKLDLARATKETQLLKAIDTDLLAQILVTEAWVRSDEKDMARAIAAYRNAVQLWNEKHPSPYVMTGWTYVLLGKAYAQNGSITDALDNMEHGIEILRTSVGEKNPTYLAARIAYAGILYSSGAIQRATDIKTSSEEAFRELYRRGCVNCRISVAALR